jgi:hypothetical protein
LVGAIGDKQKIASAYAVRIEILPVILAHSQFEHVPSFPIPSTGRRISLNFGCTSASPDNHAAAQLSRH